MINYKKLFGSIRVFLGILVISYPIMEYMKVQNNQFSIEQNIRWLFVFLFFLLYSWSAIQNGIRELKGELPKFNLPRFFEASMNGFLGIYMLIFLFFQQLNGYAKFMLALVALITLTNMVRDLRIISLQYYEKRQKMKSRE